MQSVDVKGALCLIGRTSLVGEVRRSWFEGLNTGGEDVERSKERVLYAEPAIFVILEPVP
jgi:hypothetical protein